MICVCIILVLNRIIYVFTLMVTVLLIILYRYEWYPPGPPSPQRTQPPVAPKPMSQVCPILRISLF